MRRSLLLLNPSEEYPSLQVVSSTAGYNVVRAMLTNMCRLTAWDPKTLPWETAAEMFA